MHPLHYLHQLIKYRDKTLLYIYNIKKILFCSISSVRLLKRFFFKIIYNN